MECCLFALTEILYMHFVVLAFMFTGLTLVKSKVFIYLLYQCMRRQMLRCFKHESRGSRSACSLFCLYHLVQL